MPVKLREIPSTADRQRETALGSSYRVFPQDGPNPYREKSAGESTVNRTGKSRKAVCCELSERLLRKWKTEMGCILQGEVRLCTDAILTVLNVNDVCIIFFDIKNCRCLFILCIRCVKDYK